jgi:hypothetical protein
VLTLRHVESLFASDAVTEAVHLLEERCADSLPLLGTSGTPESLERVRFAALRVSNGDLSKLRSSIDLANLDWRDLLVEADFANDTRAHLGWKPGGARAGRTR